MNGFFLAKWKRLHFSPNNPRRLPLKDCHYVMYIRLLSDGIIIKCTFVVYKNRQKNFKSLFSNDSHNTHINFVLLSMKKMKTLCNLPKLCLITALLIIFTIKSRTAVYFADPRKVTKPFTFYFDQIKTINTIEYNTRKVR